MEIARTPDATSAEAVQPKKCTTKPGLLSPPTVLPELVPASKSSAEQVSVNRTGVSKPRQSKSRNGCMTCKTKRLKCDETKPTCQQCHKRNVSCGGYKKDFKWRPFEESTFTTKSIAKVKKGLSLRAPPPSPSTPTCKPARSVLSSLTPYNSNSPEEDVTSQYHSLYSTLESIAPLPPYDSYQRDIFPSILDLQDQYLDDYEYDDMMPGLSYFSSAQSPKVSENILINNMVAGVENTPQWLSSSVPLTPALIDLRNDDVEEIVRQSPPEKNVTSSWSTLSTSIPCFKTIFKRTISQGPSLHPESPAMLLTRYDRQTCGILSVKDGISENPWRTLIWPLAVDCPALFHAICCLSAFHCVKENPRLRVHGMDHMRQSISMLATGIGTMKTDEALATTLALVFAESWDRHISTGVQHLRGARILLNQAVIQQQQRTDMQADDLGRLRFLYNTWLYTDVIARLISLEDGEFEEVALPHDFTPSLPYSPVHEVDPLMGCATTLFPLISRVANLVQKVRRSKTNSIPIISQAMELKTLIEEWEVPKYFQPPVDPTSNVQHSFQTAQAYRWATLLYLHQAVPEIPSESAAQLAKRVLVLLATVPPSSRATIVHIYPLLVASCEMKNGEDRNWVKERWGAMQSRLMIGNVDRCLEVVREVWDRKDEYDRQNMRSTEAAFVQLVDTTKRKSIYGVGIGSVVDDEDDLSEDSATFEHSDQRPTNRQILASPGDVKMPRSISSPRQAPVSPIRRGSFIPGVDSLGIENTVRGRLHWVGVMKDWGWEGDSSMLISYTNPTHANAQLPPFCKPRN
ncbi:uncharacterized protein PADG_04643 [Paracoccidioides brasiliensis Pb18]|uniref:Zn(2)-C6 fungal-type domain-containing protein n=1 Tax=Paracoccidioides brasiliensis (strain Pb18) TaxID=502780 RepID=C1GCC1_PARBD|nr:uncharacterized protein PADG_04643 [Paracoccidioides brasiliensis Pb18]EEH48564.2 hypothetical protein PADG_04643 [Paracoccidioides brasiliensis Pb18]